jgi:hypothetical protein
MDKFDKLFEKYFLLLEFEQGSFSDIVNQYSRIVDIIFADKIFNRGRYYTTDYFAVYIANRVTHIDNKSLLHALRACLDKKWESK